ncbi:tetratricopeptide repeat protein [Thalassotalea profundi]|uniref:Transcriptional regulator n=1 Tax=Thalassotalea profundi TaxID=2036687 RepID=A0ABQ3II02_9GAMM|nr:tetratricopeptide repeat protein [Thalassotalea profundi]GHE85161.1 transcriptional regulator [Thalassotalea profundi]
MNDLLLSEINAPRRSLLNQLSLLETSIFGQSTDINKALAPLIDSCSLAMNDHENSMDRAEVFINEIFISQLLIDNSRALWPVLSYRIAESVNFKVIAPVVKAAVIQYVANKCELETEIVYLPEKVMIRILCDDIYSIIFDPITGESLNWQELEQGLDDLGGDPSRMQLIPMEQESIVVEYLTGLKNSLINESSFEKALKCVDLLLSMRPDDPFERRDRGFLLHQLDCFKVAYDDYQYFVAQCPKDPAAQLLKLQLDNISVKDTVLH